MSRRKRDFRWAKWVLFLVLIVAAVTVVILVKNNYFDKKPENTNQTQQIGKTENKKDNENKEQQKTEEGTKDESKQEEKVPQYDGGNPNKSETLTGMVTYADVINDELVIRTNIDQFLETGSCELTMSRNGAAYYSRSVAIIASVTTSTCDGFKIPVSELSSGDFVVEINLNSGEKNGKITGRVRI